MSENPIRLIIWFYLLIVPIPKVLLTFRLSVLSFAFLLDT